MVSYGFLVGILAGVGAVAGIAMLVPQGDSASIATGICTIEINGTANKVCSKIHDSINLNSTRQLAFSYDTRTETFGFDVMTNSTKLTWTVISDTAGVTWLAQPAATTELLGLTQFRTKLDLSGYDEVRLNAIVATVGLSGSTLSVQYAEDCSSWADISATNPTVALDATSMKTSVWQKLAANAKDDVCLRIVGTGGNGILNPVFNSLNVQLR